MSRQTITFTAETSKVFAADPKELGGYHATIQNLTNQSITITVTNQNIQEPTPEFDTPAAGALVIAAGAIGSLAEPYQGWKLTCAAATGTVEITEAG